MLLHSTVSTAASMILLEPLLFSPGKEAELSLGTFRLLVCNKGTKGTLSSFVTIGLFHDYIRTEFCSTLNRN